MELNANINQIESFLKNDVQFMELVYNRNDSHCSIDLCVEQIPFRLFKNIGTGYQVFVLQDLDTTDPKREPVYQFSLRLARAAYNIQEQYDLKHNE